MSDPSDVSDLLGECYPPDAQPTGDAARLTTLPGEEKLIEEYDAQNRREAILDETETVYPVKRTDEGAQVMFGPVTRARAKQIVRRLPRASDEDVHEMYQEVMGADFSGSVTTDRARESIAEALEECFTGLEGKHHRQRGAEMESNETKPTADVADLVGGSTAPASVPAQPAAPASAPVAKEETVKKTAKKSAPKKAATPKVRKDPTILLRNPEIKRDKDGKILHIVGTCTWKEGGKFACERTRKIHAADAFQVRYCEEHKVAARNAARAAKASKGKKK